MLVLIVQKKRIENGITQIIISNNDKKKRHTKPNQKKNSKCVTNQKILLIKRKSNRLFVCHYYDYFSLDESQSFHWVADGRFFYFDSSLVFFFCTYKLCVRACFCVYNIGLNRNYIKLNCLLLIPLFLYSQSRKINIYVYVMCTQCAHISNIKHKTVKRVSENK